jgi:uncharacterized protein YoxC
VILQTEIILLAIAFAAIAIAILVILIRTEPNTVVIGPTLDNAGKITYVDKNGVCYRYKIDWID